jgi:transposase
VSIRLSAVERQELERLSRAAKAERRLVDRARAILLAADGWGNVAIAAYLHRHRSWVQKWRRRFDRDRLAGLQDRPRSGRPPRLSPPAAGARRRAGLHTTR